MHAVTADAFLRLLLRSLLLLLLLLLEVSLELLLWLESERQRGRCCFLFSPLSLAPISPFLSLRSVLSRALPARLSWLLAILFRSLAPSAGVGRCPCGPTKAFRHHVMCLFDTSLSSYIEFVSFVASTQFLLRCHLFFIHRALPGAPTSLFFSSLLLSFSFSRVIFLLALSTHSFLLLLLSLHSILSLFLGLPLF